MAETINLLDVVALVRDRLDLSLRRGTVGAVVEIYSGGDCEVEFVDAAGRTYGVHTLPLDDLMLLHYEPQRVAG